MENKSIIFFLVSVFLTLLYLSIEDTNIRLLTILFFYINGSLLFKGNLLNPFIWLSPFIIIYNTSIYVLDLLGVRECLYFYIIQNCVFLSVFTLFVYCVFFIRTTKKHNAISYTFLNIHREKILKKLMFVFGGMLLCYIPYFFSLGYTSKMETNANGGLMGFGLVTKLFEMSYILYIIYQCHLKNKYPYKYTLMAIGISLLISLFVGERDVFFSILLMSFFVYYYYFRPKFKAIFLVAVFGIIMVPILGMTKQITNQGELSFQPEIVVTKIFQGEFLSSGRNIETILYNRADWTFRYGRDFFNDLGCSIIPSSIMSINNTTGWYNDNYNSLRGEGYGAGFSYVGEGYLQGGYIGVAIWMLILSLICHSLYLWSQKTIYGLTSYIIMISIIIYSMRGDLSYIFSPLLKEIFCQYVLFLYMFKFFTPRKTMLYKSIISIKKQDG